MNPIHRPPVPQPIRFPDEEENLIETKDPIVNAPIRDSIVPYGYEDKKEYSWR